MSIVATGTSLLLNPVSKWEEFVEIDGVTLYDTHRKARDQVCHAQQVDTLTVMHTHATACGRCRSTLTTISDKLGTDLPNLFGNHDQHTHCYGGNFTNKQHRHPTFTHLTIFIWQCLHRFCGDCIQKCLRYGKRECPSCRKKAPSRRSLR